jgi:hypothetical protein
VGEGAGARQEEVVRRLARPGDVMLMPFSSVRSMTRAVRKPTYSVIVSSRRRACSSSFQGSMTSTRIPSRSAASVARSSSQSRS